MKHRRNVNGLYDPVVNARLYHLAGDGDTNGLMLVYRYRRAGREVAPRP